MRSSELELGAAGRERALQLREAAQTAAEASWNAQVVDLGLAEAAMVNYFPAFISFFARSCWLLVAHVLHEPLTCYGIHVLRAR